MSIHQNINVESKTDNISKKYLPQETWTCTNGYIIINLWPQGPIRILTTNTNDDRIIIDERKAWKMCQICSKEVWKLTSYNQNQYVVYDYEHVRT